MAGFTGGDAEGVLPERFCIARPATAAALLSSGQSSSEQASQVVEKAGITAD
jgi:hypothetical protein